MRDLTGMTFGQLTVVGRNGHKPNGKKPESAWLCHCSCGKNKTVARSALVKGLTKSCGCLLAAWRHSDRKHGHAKDGTTTSEYRSYNAMRRRCLHPKSKDFPNYGGRGISICERWLQGDGSSSGFLIFLKDMGLKPSAQHTLERRDSNEDYYPSNCCWALPKDQTRNRRISLRDGRKTLAEISEETGINYYTLVSRWNAGDRGDRLKRPTKDGTWERRSER